MSSADVITLPKLLSKVPEIFGNLPGLIKGSKMSKITDTNTPLGLGVAFEKATDSNPNGVAILYEDRELTYKQFNAWANRIADYLASIGLKKGDTVAVDVENRPELLATVLGCAKLGVCSALINTSQKGKVLTHSFNLVEPKAAIIGQELVEVIQEVRDDLDLKQNFFYFADQDTLADPGTAPEGFTNLATEINRAQVSFSGFEHTALTLGRQRIILGDARHVGNVGFRQNEQTFDALRLAWTGAEHLKLDYIYLDRVHRIFGDDHPAGEWDLDAHLIDATLDLPGGSVLGFIAIGSIARLWPGSTTTAWVVAPGLTV